MCFNVHYLEWVGINTEAKFAFVFSFCWMSYCRVWAFLRSSVGDYLLLHFMDVFCLKILQQFLVSCVWMENMKSMCHIHENMKNVKVRKYDHKEIVILMRWLTGSLKIPQAKVLPSLLSCWDFCFCLFSLFPVLRLNRCRFLQFNFPIVTCAGHTPFLFL